MDKALTFKFLKGIAAGMYRIGYAVVSVNMLFPRRILTMYMNAELTNIRRLWFFFLILLGMLHISSEGLVHRWVKKKFVLSVVLWFMIVCAW